MPELRRETWTDLSDSALLAQCELDTYRASGPGGQKRNKTSSAVRIPGDRERRHTRRPDCILRGSLQIDFMRMI